MQAAMPFIRDQGSGTAVLCLHSNASTATQWRALADLLADRRRVIAVDGYGAGKSPEWPGGRAMRLADEVELVAPAVELAGERFDLIGHSYGAAVAVKLVLTYPARVRSLVLYEPTLFHLVAGADPSSSPAAGVWH
ncbi:MAG: alpha/beta hydrolase, partial [Pseudomonadota bacterium]|nr:alpha/beta hydrolase [Pseudomonadota bacterium]